MILPLFFQRGLILGFLSAWVLAGGGGGGQMSSPSPPPLPPLQCFGCGESQDSHSEARPVITMTFDPPPPPGRPSPGLPWRGPPECSPLLDRKVGAPRDTKGQRAGSGNVRAFSESQAFFFPPHHWFYQTVLFLGFSISKPHYSCPLEVSHCSLL